MIINIKDLEIYSYIGAHKEEQILGQKILISVEISINDTKQLPNVNYIINNDEQSLDNHISLNYSTLIKEINHFVLSVNYLYIEELANNLALKIINKYRYIDYVNVKISKPHVPIKYHYNEISVSKSYQWHEVFLSLGANIGNAYQTLLNVFNDLKINKFLNDVIMTDIIKTEPYGNKNQNYFFNSVVKCKTYLSPKQLLIFINNIENKYGRQRLEHWGPRTCDIDILFYDNLIISTDELTIPHYDMHNRYFVLFPLSQLCPYKIIPNINKTVLQCLNDLQ